MKNDGILAEAKVMTWFLERDYDVFNQFGGKAPFDLVVHKDDILSRVSVKSTSSRTNSGRWLVQIGRVRSNRNGNTIYKFSPNEQDILAVYILPEDRVVIIDAKTITTGRMLTID